MSSDPIRDHMRHELDIFEAEELCPKCTYCGQPITEEYCYAINRDIYHEDCIEHFLTFTENFKRGW